jgi:hypothetical protein
MKTPRELVLARHQSAEAKLKAIRAEDLAACARSAAEPGRQRPPAFDLAAAARRFWLDTFEPWRRAWIGIGAVWAGLLVFSLATGETPQTAPTKPPRPDPEALAVLREQKELRAQLLGTGELTLVSHLQTPGPRSAAEPPPGRDERASRLGTTQRADTCAQA